MRAVPQGTDHLDLLGYRARAVRMNKMFATPHPVTRPWGFLFSVHVRLAFQRLAMRVGAWPWCAVPCCVPDVSRTRVCSGLHRRAAPCLTWKAVNELRKLDAVGCSPVQALEAHKGRPYERLHLPLDHRLLDLGDGFRRVEVFRAGLRAVHDGVAAVEAERVLQVVEPLAGRLVARGHDPAPRLPHRGGPEIALRVPPVGRARG